MRFLAHLVVVLFMCAPLLRADDLSDLRTQLLADTNTSPEIKAAIEKRLVITGMCPQEAFAAAGYPGPYMVQADKTKWKDNIPPPVIIEAQCKNPDDSVIELMFQNSTQFATNKPVIFRVRFEKGRAVIIDQKGFSTLTDKTKQAEPGGVANGSQPIRSDTNSTSSAAGSRR